MKFNNILVVEDEINISNVIKAYLEKNGYNVKTAYDGQEALDQFNNNDIHLVILDLMLPKLSGENVCKEIRKISNVPIIMLTAKSEDEDKIEGFSIGADEYVVKPFSPKVLVSRVEALLRRTYDLKNIKINSGIELDTDKYIAKKDGNILDLTTNEFKVLSILYNNPDIIFSRERLIELAFGMGYEGYDRTIDTYIKNIRQKIEKDPKNPKYIQTVYGVGYKYVEQGVN